MSLESLKNFYSYIYSISASFVKCLDCKIIEILRCGAYAALALLRPCVTGSHCR
jgi:hypothetical protein